MAAIDPKGNETYWIEGIPFQGVRNQNTLVGTERYWVNGLPEQNITPLNNQDTGRFFIVFDEI